MINKRKGFKPRALMNKCFNRQESFDPTFQFRPFKLYIITTEDESYAITGEDGSDSVFLDKPNKNNKYQWVLIDSDTGAICFFYDLKSYMSIDLVDGIVKVKRSDILKDGLFNFKADNTILLKSNPNFCLGFRKISQPKEDANTNTNTDAKTTETKKESFFNKIHYYLSEKFNPSTQPVLEAIQLSEIKKTPSNFSNTWKYVEIVDLRNLADNADTINELTQINNNDNKQITALQKMIETNKQMNDIDIKYRDDTIKGYEQNWFIKMFLKPSGA